VDRRACIRLVDDHGRRWAARVCADELARQGRPHVGSAWTPRGPPGEGLPPGTHAQHAPAGALARATGPLPRGLGPRTTPARFRALWPRRDAADPVTHATRGAVVAEHAKRPQAKAVEPWVATPPRVALRVWPTDCPRAHPSARALGEGPDGGPREPRRKRVRELVPEVGEPLQVHGPWPDPRSALDPAPAVTAAVERVALDQPLATAR
jgi:hypothetical protein